MPDSRWVPTWASDHPRVITAVLSVAGYAFVAASFLGAVPFPSLSRSMVVTFSDLIAVINTAALIALLAGYRFIKRGQRRRHMVAMSTAFGLILLFLFVYTWKQSGGFTKSLVISQGQFLSAYATPITDAYWIMLGIHILLSVLAVPVVLHAVVLAATQPIDSLGETVHPTVGRLAVATWTLSLALGILTYWILNHVYGWEAIHEGAALAAVAVPALDSWGHRTFRR